MRALFRQFTNEQLAACGEAVAAFAGLVLDRLGGAAGPLFLRANPFEGPEQAITPDEARSFLSRLGRDRTEVFDLYSRPFQFVLRVCAALTRDVYKYQDRHYSKLPYPPPCAHGYRIECALSKELLDEKVLLRAFQELFERSGAVYGYATDANPLTVFSGYSDLERERNAPDRKYRAMWCDSLRQYVSGAFAANWLGPDLAARLPRTRPSGWQVEELGSGGLAVLDAGGSLRDLEAWMAGLLPPEERVPLPQVMKDSLLLRPEEVEGLGGPAFLKELGAWALTGLPSGRAVLTAEHRFRSEDQVTAECLWPLRPAKREIWEIDLPPGGPGGLSYLIDVSEPARAQVRFRISDEELSSAEGVEVCIAVMGGAAGLARAIGALEAWAARQGRRLRMERRTSRLAGARIRLDGAGLDDLIDLAEEVRSAVGKPAFLFTLGALPEDELATRLQMTGPDRLFMLL